MKFKIMMTASLVTILFAPMSVMAINFTDKCAQCMVTCINAAKAIGPTNIETIKECGEVSCKEVCQEKQR